MRGYIVRLLISAAGLWVASALLPRMSFSTFWTLLGAAFLLGIVNAFVRPLVVFLTLPATILTLGLFLLVINATMLGLVAWMLDGFELGGLASAVAASIIVAVTSWVATWFVGPRGRIQVMVARGRGARRDV